MKSRFWGILIACAVLLSGVSLAQGQSANCTELYTAANTLLTQAKAALDRGDLATATALVSSARAVLTPCLNDSRCPSVGAVGTLLEQAANSSDANVVGSLLIGAQAAFAPCLATSPALRAPTETLAPPTLRPTATPRVVRPTATPRVAPATTRTFTTTKSRVAFSLRYPTAWFDASELDNGTVILGNTVGGWVAAGLGTRPLENTDLGASVGVLRLDSAPNNIASILSGVLSRNENTQNFSTPRRTTIGTFTAAYSDIGTVGRRVVLIDLGNNYVALANIYAHPQSMNRLYPQVETILASLRVR